MSIIRQEFGTLYDDEIFEYYTHSDFTWVSSASQFRMDYTVPTGYQLQAVTILTLNGTIPTGVCSIDGQIRITGTGINGDFQFRVTVMLRKI